MRLSTYHYARAQGWDRSLDPSLDGPTTWIIVFGAPAIADLAQGLADLHRVYPRAVWTGCSTAGEVLGDSLHDDSLVVAVLQFSHTRLLLASAPIASPMESAQVGVQLGAQLNAPDLKAVFLLSDGLSVNGSSLIEALSSQFAAGVVVTGGLAGDGDRFQKTWVIGPDHSAQTQTVTAVGLYGERLGVGHASRGGWDVLGPEREITQSLGNVVFSIDEQPALALYKKYLGERAQGLPATGLLFPLAIRNERHEDGDTVRTILAVNEADNSITFAGDVPQGSKVRLMRANFERLIDGAEDAAHHLALGPNASGPLLIIGISCVGRRLVLGQRTEEEIEAVRRALPPDSSFVGYYSYGELSPLASGRCELHNQTMTLTSVWET